MNEGQLFPAEIQRRAQEIRWYHTIDLGSGVITGGVDNTPLRLKRIGLPERLDRLSVLDVGAWDGFFSFEAERRGAARVLATDHFSWNGAGWGSKRGFDLARSTLRSRVEDLEIDVPDISPATVGNFDIVLFLGVLYHLKEPFSALERMAAVTKKLLIVETVVDLLNVGRPAMAFYPNAELNDDATNWWAPNPACLTGMLPACGFREVRCVYSHPLAKRFAYAVAQQVREKLRSLPFFDRAGLRSTLSGVNLLILQRFLAAVQRHKALGWLGLLIYAPAVTFPHDVVQGWAAWIVIHYTRRRLYQGSAAGAVVIALVLSLMFLLAVRRQPERRAIGALWILNLLLMAGTWWIFMANNTELIHFPQYFPEGMVLLALTASPVEAIAWATVLGGLDECFQYWTLVQGKPVPYDFNDIFMDLLGGAAGVVFAMALLRVERRANLADWWKRVLKSPGVLVIFGIIAAGIVLWATGAMTLYEAPGAPPHWFSLSRQHDLPFWFSAPNLLGPRTFHELSPVEGPLLLLIALAGWSLVDRRFRIPAPGGEN